MLHVLYTQYIWVRKDVEHADRWSWPMQAISSTKPSHALMTLAGSQHWLASLLFMH